MTSIWAFVMAHQTTVALIAFWLFSNVATALPSPSNDSAMFYKFFFALVHGMSGSLARVFPQARILDPTSTSQSYFAAPKNP